MYSIVRVHIFSSHIVHFVLYALCMHACVITTRLWEVCVWLWLGKVCGAVLSELDYNSMSDG